VRTTGVAPAAALIPAQSIITAGDTVEFTNQSTGSTPLTYSWDFGDGSPLSSEVHASHTYHTIGAFTVILTATNAYGEDVATGTVEVRTTGVAPAAAFTPAQSVIAAGDTIAFTNQSTGSTPLSYLWDFGDGSPLSSQVHASHTYNDSGAFTVTLTATNAYGEDVASGAVTVDGTPPTSAVDPLVATQDSTSFSVSWSGADAASDVLCYDVQHRDGADGEWTGWKTCVTETSATFTGAAGRTYYFRSRAQDSVGNWESYPTNPDYDTYTTLPRPPHPPPASYQVFLPVIVSQ
jgi:PKD repeat protein